MMGTYELLDLVPEGRAENDGPYKMDWVRHHDRYEPAPAAGACRHHGLAASPPGQIGASSVQLSAG